MKLYQHDIEQCLDILQKGGLILYPTDTVWGIGCDAQNKGAVEKIFNLKKRNEKKSMIVLIADESEITQFTNEAFPTVFDFIKGVHKPVTVVYPKAKNLAPNLLNADGSIAIRIVKKGFAKDLLKKFGKPIVSTSANLSGYPAPGNFYDVDIAIKKGVSYVVEFSRDVQKIASPSTVVTVDAKGKINILRP
ncbi:MAG: L-threonylcarbamoyladenylate synthase [Ferruginibacter sp.]